MSQCQGQSDGDGPEGDSSYDVTVEDMRALAAGDAVGQESGASSTDSEPDMLELRSDRSAASPPRLVTDDEGEGGDEEADDSDDGRPPSVMT